MQLGVWSWSGGVSKRNVSRGKRRRKIASHSKGVSDPFFRLFCKWKHSCLVTKETHDYIRRWPRRRLNPPPHEHKYFDWKQRCSIEDNLSLEKPFVQFPAVPRNWSFKVQRVLETVANSFANSCRTSNIYLSKSNSAQRWIESFMMKLGWVVLTRRTPTHVRFAHQWGIPLITVTSRRLYFSALSHKHNNVSDWTSFQDWFSYHTTMFLSGTSSATSIDNTTTVGCQRRNCDNFFLHRIV